MALWSFLGAERCSHASVCWTCGLVDSSYTMGSPPQKLHDRQQQSLSSQHTHWFSDRCRNMCPRRPPENPGSKSLECSYWTLFPRWLSGGLITRGRRAQGSAVCAAGGSFPLGGIESVRAHSWAGRGDLRCRVAGTGPAARRACLSPSVLSSPLPVCERTGGEPGGLSPDPRPPEDGAPGAESASPFFLGESRAH